MSPIVSLTIGNVWDSREITKSPMVWDFPEIWKTGLSQTRKKDRTKQNMYDCQKYILYLPYIMKYWLKNNYTLKVGPDKIKRRSCKTIKLFDCTCIGRASIDSWARMIVSNGIFASRWHDFEISPSSNNVIRPNVIGPWPEYGFVISAKTAYEINGII